jgi:hypothetical protein
MKVMLEGIATKSGKSVPETLNMVTSVFLHIKCRAY